MLERKKRGGGISAVARDYSMHERGDGEKYVSQRKFNLGEFFIWRRLDCRFFLSGSRLGASAGAGWERRAREGGWGGGLRRVHCMGFGG